MTIGALTVTAALAAALWLAVGRWPVAWWLVAATIVTFACYAWDKARAGSGDGFRIPEATLQVLTLAGGTVGALAGQRLLRHKTSKRPFQLLFRAIVAVQVVAVVSLVAVGR